MKWAAFPQGCLPAAPVKKVSRSYFETCQRVFWSIWVMTQRGISVLGACRHSSPTDIPSEESIVAERKLGWCRWWGRVCDSPRCKQWAQTQEWAGDVGDVSFSHWFQALPSTACKTLGDVAVSCWFATGCPTLGCASSRGRGHTAGAIKLSFAVMITIQIRVKIKAFHRSG